MPQTLYNTTALINMNPNTTSDNFLAKIGKWLWAISIIALYILPGQIGLGRWMVYIKPISHILIICIFPLLLCMQYFFIKKKLYKNFLEPLANKILFAYCGFALYILFSSLFIASDQIHFFQRYTASTKVIWFIRYVFFLFILQCGFVLINGFNLIKGHLYVTFRIASTLFLIYFFINVSIDKKFYLDPNCLVCGNGVGILGCRLLIFEIALLLFSKGTLKKNAGYFFFLLGLQCIAVLITSYYRQTLLGFGAIIIMYISLKETQNIKKTLTKLILFLFAIYCFSHIAPASFKRVRQAAYSKKESTRQDVMDLAAQFFDRKNKKTEIPLKYRSYREIMQLLCFVCWQYNVMFGFGYGCFSIAPHNIFFEMLGSLGLVGIALFLLPISLYIFYCGQTGFSRKKIFIFLLFLLSFSQNYYTGTYVFAPHLYWLLAFGLLSEKNFEPTAT